MGEPIRVLHVIGIMNRGGAETMIMNFYRKIDRTQYQFDFLVFHEEEGDYDKEIRELGGNIYHLPLFKVYNYFSFKKACKTFFRKHHWQIVHGHIRSCASIFLDIAKKNGSFTIAHSHSTDSNNLIIRFLFHGLTYRIRYVADYFFACSKEAGVAGFGKKVVASWNFQVLNNAIDCPLYKYSLDRYRKLREQFRYEEKKVIGHVGRFVDAKNHDFIIEVFKEIEKKDKDVILVLVGQGPLEEKIKSKVKSYNLEDKVAFLGLRNDIPDIMNLFDLFLFPSLYEGLGIVGIEAQAAGLPCVFSDKIPKLAIVTDNVEVLSLSDKAEKWADKIITKLTTFQRKDVSEIVAENGFDINIELEKLIEIYNAHKKQ